MSNENNEQRLFQIEVEVKVSEMASVWASSPEEALDKYGKGELDEEWFADNAMPIGDPEVSELD